MNQKVCVIGLGYVGLTLTGALLKAGHSVVGLEINSEIIKSVNQGKSHFHEPGLNVILEKSILSKKLKCFHPNDHVNIKDCSIFIITVGTPLIANKKSPNLNYIKESLQIIAPYDKDKLIILKVQLLLG